MRSIHFGFMKILILFSITFLITISCDVNDPKKDNPKPEGYQEDIPWPSLADSPWPRYHGNAQNNGRTNIPGPQIGKILTTLNTPQLLGGIVIGADSNIYFCTAEYVYSVKKNGIENWRVAFSKTEIESPPLIGSDGTIYVGLLQGEKLVALNNDGLIKWSTTIPGGIASRFSIGKDGIIYVTNIFGTLFAVDRSGVILWQLADNDFRASGNYSFSVDGKTLYLSSRSKTVMAVDLESHAVLWKFGTYSNSTSVDAQGNIYVVGKGPEGDTIFYYSLNADGSIRWKHQLTNWEYFGDQDPTIDRYGNSYIAEDTLYSFDYKGKLRWKRSFSNEYFRSPILCDKDNTLYAISESDMSESMKVYSFNNNGTIKWILPFEAEGIIYPSGALGYDNHLYFSTDNGSSTIFIVQ